MTKGATEKYTGIVLKGYPRVSEPFISNELRLLEKAGFRLRLFSIRDPGEDMQDGIASQVNAPVVYLTPQFKGYAFSLFRDAAHVAVRRPLRFLRAASVAAWWTWKRRTWAVCKHFLQAAHLVRHYLSGGEIGHLHAHFAHNPANVAMYASLLTGMPFSFTAHAKDIWSKDPGQLAEKIKRAELVLTCTEYNRDYLKRLNSAGTPIRRAYHGVDTALFSGRNTRTPEPPYTILSVARMVDKKGLDTVLASLALLKKQGVEFRFRHVGDGKRAERLKQLAGALGVDDCVQWLGSMPREKVVEEYLNADVLVLGCRVAPDGDRDGIPNVLAEAMALGLPSVCGKVSAVPELVRHEVDGLLIPSDDPEAMTEAINRCLTDHELRKTIRKNGPQRVRDMFDSEKTIMDVVNALKDLGVHP